MRCARLLEPLQVYYRIGYSCKPNWEAAAGREPVIMVVVDVDVRGRCEPEPSPVLA